MKGPRSGPGPHPATYPALVLLGAAIVGGGQMAGGGAVVRIAVAVALIALVAALLAFVPVAVPPPHQSDQGDPHPSREQEGS